MAENETSKKLLWAILVIAGIVLLLNAATLTYAQKEKSDEKIQKAAEEKRIRGMVLEDMITFYRALKLNANFFNKQIAKITHNHTRDTVVHDKLTVETLHRAHYDLTKSLDFAPNVNNMHSNRLSVDQLQKIFPMNYETNEWLGTYRLRDAFIGEINKLEEAYIELINHTNPKDSVDTYARFQKPKFTRYLNTLENIDRLYYEFLSNRYPRSIALVVDKNPEYIERLAQTVHGDYNMVLENGHEALKYPDTSFWYDEKVYQCTLSMSDSITTYVVKTNRGKKLLLARTDMPLNEVTTEVQEKVLQELKASAKDALGDVAEANFYYQIRSNMFDHYAKGRNGKITTLGESEMDSLLSFYKGDYYNYYYIVGDYDAYNTYYPNERKRIDSVQNAKAAIK